MTPEERKSMIQGMIVELLADVRHAAIAEEREACARIADECLVSPGIAEAIRARGKP